MALIDALPASLTDELTAFILRTNAENLLTDGYCSDAATLTDEETGDQTCRLSGADIYDFRAADNSFYDTVRAVCEVTQTEACETG